MNLKNNLFYGLALTTLTLTYGCSTAPKTKDDKATPFAVIDYSRVWGNRGNAQEGGDLVVATSTALERLTGASSHLAQDFLDEGRALTGVTDGNIEAVTAKMSQDEKIEFVKKFRDAHLSAFSASADLKALSGRINSAYTDLKAAGNTEQTATEIATHIQGGEGSNVAVSAAAKQQVGQLLAQSSSLPKDSPAFLADTSAVTTWSETGILTLTPDACKDFGPEAMANSAKNQKQAEELAESLTKKYPKDVQKRKNCFSILEAQRFLTFVQVELGGSIDDAIALAADCHQTAVESLEELQKIKAGQGSDASGCQ